MEAWSGAIAHFLFLQFMCSCVQVHVTKTLILRSFLRLIDYFSFFSKLQSCRKRNMIFFLYPFFLCFWDLNFIFIKSIVFVATTKHFFNPLHYSGCDMRLWGCSNPATHANHDSVSSVQWCFVFGFQVVFMFIMPSRTPAGISAQDHLGGNFYHTAHHELAGSRHVGFEPSHHCDWKL